MERSITGRGPQGLRIGLLRWMLGELKKLKSLKISQSLQELKTPQFVCKTGTIRKQALHLDKSCRCRPQHASHTMHMAEDAEADYLTCFPEPSQVPLLTFTLSIRCTHHHCGHFIYGMLGKSILNIAAIRIWLPRVSGTSTVRTCCWKNAASQGLLYLCSSYQKASATWQSNVAAWLTTCPLKVWSCHWASHVLRCYQRPFSVLDLSPSLHPACLLLSH
jgi:hypothetical protein